ncbi:MAG: phage holin family protein, partial [Bacteroidota bacterium]
LFAIVNTFVKPLFLLITIPVNILTLGLFTFVINALMVLLVGKLMSSFTVKDFWWALIFSLGMSVASTMVGWFGFPV